jgi:hypothetical protein
MSILPTLRADGSEAREAINAVARFVEEFQSGWHQDAAFATDIM